MEGSKGQVGHVGIRKRPGPGGHLGDPRSRKIKQRCPDKGPPGSRAFLYLVRTAMKQDEKIWEPKAAFLFANKKVTCG